MSAKIEMIGRRFGRLTVLKESPSRKWSQVWWECKCDCGNTKIVAGRDLRFDRVQSCGCLQLETMQKRWETMKKYNEFKADGNVVYVKLSNCDKEMICDLEDWERLKKYCWAFDASTGYAKSIIGHAHSAIHKSMHPLVTDHINRNKLDNRRKNLRSVTRRENALNSDRHDRTLALMEGKIF